MISNDVFNLFHSTVADAVEEHLTLELNSRVWLIRCREAIEEQKEAQKQGIESDFPEALELTDDELLKAMHEVLVDHEPFCTHDVDDLVAQNEDFAIGLERRDRKFGPFVTWIT